MKRFFYLSACMMVVALCGCTQDVEVIVPQPSVPDGAIAININGSISQEYTTRVDDGGFCDGDQIGLYGVNYTDKNATQGVLIDSGNQVDNARYTYDEKSMTWTSSGSVYYKDAETNIDLYAYYPYSNPQSVGAYKFEVAQDQSGENAIDGYSQSDFLWAYAENVAPSSNAIKLRFSHRLSCVNVVLNEGSGFDAGEWDALDKGVLVMSTARTADIDLSTGVATATGEVALEGIVMKDGAEGFRAIVVPQSVDAGKTLLDITVDGITRRFKTDVVTNYEAGKQTKYTLKVNKKSHSGEFELELAATEIIDWVADLDTHGGEARQYYVAHCEEPGTLEATIKAAGKDAAKIKNLKVSGKIALSDFYFMRDQMTILSAINLKECEIFGDSRKWYWYGIIDGVSQYVYFTTDMPASWEEAMREVEERFPNSDILHQGFLTNSNYGVGANEIPDNAFDGKSSLVYFVFPEYVTKIGYYAFSGTLLSGALIIPDDVVEIGRAAFYSTNITSLRLPHNLKVLGGTVFSECKSLSGELYLPESLESIGESCFYFCSMLSGSLVLPHKLTEIPSHCFSSCRGLNGSITIPENIKTICRHAFSGCYNLNGTLTLPEGLQKVDDNAFSGTPLQGELVIPASLKIISREAFWTCNFSSITFAENSELISIDNDAFRANTRLSEAIVLPEGLMTIGSGAFQTCSILPEITIPKSVTTIGNNAFTDCYYLSKITCEATTPPVCGSGVFDGVAKDNFTLEVPEQSVVKYQTAAGWSDFRRIDAHYDFSISRSLMRALNSECSRELLLRVPAGQAWSVESCPEWVTVTPSEGVGKTDVVVTISSMEDAEVGTFETPIGTQSNGYVNYETNSGRGGEVVFLLNDKDYRSTLKVEQYDCDNYDGEVIVNQTATQGDGVNIVFMGDCFDARDIAHGSYLAGINEAIDHYFAIEPYKTYRDHFNVYTIVGVSPDSGMGTVNTIKDAKFGSQYSLAGISPDTQTTFEYAMLAETVNEGNLNESLVVMVENTTDYGGICYMWGDGSAIACCPMSADAYPFDFRGIVQHEAGGHGFAKLADEYIYHNAFIQTCGCACCDHLVEFRVGKALGWYRNLSESGDMKIVEWAHLIYHPDYSNIVDMYEGGYFHTRGIYRSEATSCMNNNIPYYSAISRQEMVERIMRYGGLEFDINDFYARDVRDASNNTRAEFNPIESSLVVSNSGAGKQMPPKYMGDKPQLKNSNK